MLLIQNDYNSKGHNQWFNFKAMNLKEDTVYEFEIGPFKKSKSKFEEGMLPWICDLNIKHERQARFPYHQSIADEYVTGVTYTSKRKSENGKNMSFLNFRIFIPRTSTDYSNDRNFLIAYSEPYTYSRLQSLLTEVEKMVLMRKSKWLNFKVGRLCNSLGGISIPLLKIS